MVQQKILRCRKAHIDANNDGIRINPIRRSPLPGMPEMVRRRRWQLVLGEACLQIKSRHPLGARLQKGIQRISGPFEGENKGVSKCMIWRHLTGIVEVMCGWYIIYSHLHGSIRSTHLSRFFGTSYKHRQQIKLSCHDVFMENPESLVWSLDSIMREDGLRLET